MKTSSLIASSLLTLLISLKYFYSIGTPMVVVGVTGTKPGHFYSIDTTTDFTNWEQVVTWKSDGVNLQCILSVYTPTAFYRATDWGTNVGGI
jgi:hypothetical protein